MADDRASWDAEIARTNDSGALYAYAYGLARGMVELLIEGNTDPARFARRFRELEDAVDRRVRELEFAAATVLVRGIEADRASGHHRAPEGPMYPQAADATSASAVGPSGAANSSSCSAGESPSADPG